MKKEPKIKNKVLRILLRIVIGVVLALVLVGLIYGAYLLIDYHRLDDNLELAVNGSGYHYEDLNVFNDRDLEITTWNIGFGAYEDDFGFFMDGGTESRARSEEGLLDNLGRISDKINGYNSDFLLIQEIDYDSTRARHVDEKTFLEGRVVNSGVDIIKDGKVIDHANMPKYSWTFADNYDSPYLVYPPDSPIGASKSGIMTLSTWDFSSSIRRSLPVQKGFAKFLDLDRCYSKNYVPVNALDGQERYLVLYNFHMSAYTTDPEIVTRQVEMINNDMLEEYEKGNYVIAGGDFNMDVLGDSSKYFGIPKDDYSWAKSYPIDKIPEGFTLQAPIDPENPVPSCRNADGPWDPETQFQITIDGFITSDNVIVKDLHVVDENFENSDHNPVTMMFSLKTMYE